MGETSVNEVLRRKAKAGREVHQARVMTPARALRLALSRSAEKLFELALAVTSVQNERLGQDGLLRSVDEDMLFIVLDGPQGAIGAVAMDMPVVSGFVEKQTIGHVSTRASGERAATATDAALVAPYIGRVLDEMTEHLGPEDGKITEGYRFGARIESKRHLGLILEASEFHLLRGQLELEGGVRRGELVLCLPVAEPLEQRPQKPGRADKAAPNGAGGESNRQNGKLRDGALMEARAVFRAIVHRRHISLGELAALKPGVRLQFAASALERVELDAGAGSERLGPCKLGKQDGMRALKVQFGQRAARKGQFEAMHDAEAWEAEEDMSAYPSGTLEPGAQMTPITVDDMPDLSDLPGFEDAAEDAAEPADTEGRQQAVSNVG